MKITKFDRGTLDCIRADLKIAFKSVEKAYGIKLDLGRISYRNDSFTGKINADIGDDLDIKQKRAKEQLIEWKSSCWLWDLEMNDFGKRFTFKDTIYTITGCKRTSRKYPILARRPDGKVFKFPGSLVKRNLI